MKHVIRIISHWGLLLHIYTSMAGFTLVLLFAITGLTLNHQDFGFGEPKIQTSSIDIPADVTEHATRESIGNYLRSTVGVRSPLTDYRDDPAQIQVTFAAPGHR